MAAAPEPAEGAPARSRLIDVTPHGLYCAAGGFHIDPWLPVPRAVITHAHGDHLRPGCDGYLCAAAALPLLRLRLPEATPVEAAPYGQPVVIDGVRLSFHPAGHILGSAQVRVEYRGEVWVVSGDYKRAPDPSCDAFDPQPCHTFVSEATFGLPVFRWDPPEATISEIVAWWDEMRAAGRPAVLFTYALGKAQRVLTALAQRVDRHVYIHGSLVDLNDVYRAAGVRLAETRRASDEPRATAFSGELVLAPITARGTLWMRRFKDHSAAFASGWMRLRGARRRRGYDRGFALSDHGDWDALLATVAETRAERVFVTHGYTHQLTRALTESGVHAEAWSTRFEGETEQE